MQKKLAMFIRSNLAIILRSASEKGGGDKKVKRKKNSHKYIKNEFHKIIELLVYVNEIRILQETYYRQKYKL